MLSACRFSLSTSLTYCVTARIIIYLFLCFHVMRALHYDTLFLGLYGLWREYQSNEFDNFGVNNDNRNRHFA